MNRPEVRITQQEEEIKPADISQTEREMLLAKYGYNSNQSNTNYVDNSNKNDLTFEEMCKQQDDQRRADIEKRNREMYGPKPITFGGNYDSNIDYTTDDESGLSFKVTIVSDMPIPKNYE